MIRTVALGMILSTCDFT